MESKFKDLTRELLGNTSKKINEGKDTKIKTLDGLIEEIEKIVNNFEYGYDATSDNFVDDLEDLIRGYKGGSRVSVVTKYK